MAIARAIHALEKDNKRVKVINHQHKAKCDCQKAFLATCGLSSLTGGGQKKLSIDPRFNYKSSRAPDRVDLPTLPSLPGSCEIIFLELDFEGADQ